MVDGLRIVWQHFDCLFEHCDTVRVALVLNHGDAAIEFGRALPRAPAIERRERVGREHRARRPPLSGRASERGGRERQNQQRSECTHDLQDSCGQYSFIFMARSSDVDACGRAHTEVESLSSCVPRSTTPSGARSVRYA